MEWEEIKKRERLLHRDRCRATKQEARNDIKNGYYEEGFSSTKNHKNRNCVFCDKNIKADEEYNKHFEFPYEKDQKRWFACGKCFDREYSKLKKAGLLKQGRRGDWLDKEK